MCVIVDSNKVCDVFIARNKEFEKLNQAIVTGKISFVYGGELTREYKQIGSFWRLLLAFDRQGRAKHIDDGQVERETERVRKMRICLSDDQHIVALARVGRVRLVCSSDKKLRSDVRNAKLLSGPRGNVYTKSSHYALVKKHC
jgi:hypothetical protein